MKTAIIRTSTRELVRVLAAIEVPDFLRVYGTRLYSVAPCPVDVELAHRAGDFVRVTSHGDYVISH
jgi:hypothetical protein